MESQPNNPARSSLSPFLMLRLGGVFLRSHALQHPSSNRHGSGAYGGSVRLQQATSNGSNLADVFTRRVVVGGALSNVLTRVQKAGYEKKRHIGSLPKRVWKKKKIYAQQVDENFENMGDPQTDELLRLAQEDVFQLKRDFITEKEEKYTMLEKAVDEENSKLEFDRMQLAQGNVDNVTQELFFNKALMERYRRRLTNHLTDLQFEFETMDVRKHLKDDESTVRKRRAKALDLNEWEENRGLSGKPIIIPDNIEYTTTTVTPLTLEEKVMEEVVMSKDRVKSRNRAISRHWSLYWRQGDQYGKKHGLTFHTKMLRRFAWLRNLWEDDQRCWRSPEEWHVNYTSSQPARFTDSVALPPKLVAAAHKTTMGLWERCPDIPEHRQVRPSINSHLHCPPCIAPSIWTYPGNLVCLMNRRGELDIYRCDPVDRQIWWLSRLKLAPEFLKQIPKDYDLSAVQVGESHIAMFSFQRYFVPNRTPSPYGACWLIPKAELSKGTNVSSLPPVPLRYYKPFSAKNSLFVIGYDDPSDKHYQVLVLDWGSGSEGKEKFKKIEKIEKIEKDEKDEKVEKVEKNETVNHFEKFEKAEEVEKVVLGKDATWRITAIDSIPLVWSQNILIQDYPESIHLEGTTSICKTSDDSHIFIMAPSKRGMTLFIIDTTTWDFHVEEMSCPPVWGASMVHDSLHDTLILAGGLGIYNPEPIVRTLHLGTFEWGVDRSTEKVYTLPAYAASFPLGPGSFGIIGGFWRTGIKTQNIQPLAAIHILHSTSFGEFQRNYYFNKYFTQYADPETGEFLTPEEAKKLQADAEKEDSPVAPNPNAAPEFEEEE